MAWKNRDDYVAYHAKRYKDKQEELIKLRSAPCTDCKNTYPYYVMEFDHVPERGPKKFTISYGANLKKSFQEELAKCDLVCANCHAIRTWERKQAVIA